jgi:hypothetical protein
VDHRELWCVRRERAVFSTCERQPKYGLTNIGAVGIWRVAPLISHGPVSVELPAALDAGTAVGSSSRLQDRETVRISDQESTGTRWSLNANSRLNHVVSLRRHASIADPYNSLPRGRVTFGLTIVVSCLASTSSTLRCLFGPPAVCDARSVKSRKTCEHEN